MIALAITCTLITITWIAIPIIKDNRPNNMKEKIEHDINRIIDTVSTVTGITVQEIKGTSRKREIVIARQVAVYVIHQKYFGKGYGVTWQRLGKSVCRDHSTAIHSVKTVKDAIDAKTKDLTLILNRTVEMMGEPSNEEITY